MSAAPSEDTRMRVAYIIQEYPQMSQTYVHEEVSSLDSSYNIKIFTWKKPNLARKNPHPFELLNSSSDLLEKVRSFKPHVLHSHYLHHIQLLETIASSLSIPYTIRSHSFDILKPTIEKLNFLCQAARSPWCLRVLCFPDFRKGLVSLGIPEEKAVSCWPVVNYKKFYNPNKPEEKNRIMNVGAALEKKNYKGFIELADMMRSSGKEFNLYVMGYEKDQLETHNSAKGNPVKTITCVDYEEMPKIYRNHDWLVYTGDPSIHTIGLPIAVAEAQASGIGVCLQEMPGRREGMLDYLGGAGFLFNSIEELPGIISKPISEEMRQKGLKNAKKCDIDEHKVLLTEVWDKLKTPPG